LLEELQATCAPESCSLQNPPIIALPSVKICPRLIDDDFLIIATDGLWDVMNSAQAITYVRSMVKQQTGCTMHEVAVSLVERALRSRTQDNVSCVVVDLRTS
jgi:serine/threonine protein phosphatase PrpC